MPKKTTLRGQFLRTVLLMLACSLLVGLAVIVAVMVAFVKKVPDGEQFLMDSVSFLFGKEVLGPNGMIHVVVLAAIALCLLVVLVCVLLASRYTSRVAAALRDFRRAADDLRSGELDFQILTYPERELDELAQALESVRQRLKASAAAEAAAQAAQEQLPALAENTEALEAQRDEAKQDLAETVTGSADGAILSMKPEELLQLLQEE